MTIDENNTITIYNGDYGMPITFETEGFAVGDAVIFAISGNPISPKSFTVDSDGYSFELAFTQEEAQAVVNAACCAPVNYSFKQYRSGSFLDTVANGKIKVKGTVVWQA